MASHTPSDIDYIDPMLTYSVHSEEQQPLEDFFKAKNIRFKNEMVEEVGPFIPPSPFFFT